MRILFLGTGEIGLPSLEWLLSTPKHQVVAVVTQPDKPVGRKLVLTPPEVKVRALAAGVPVHQPERLRDHVEELKHYNADIGVVIAYGQILNKAALELPRLGCINVHASLLPRHRGASPIQAAIRDGDSESGVSIMHVVKELDAGDVIDVEKTPINGLDTGGSLHDRLAKIAPAALERALDAIAAGTASRTPQDTARVTYSGKLNREDGAIDWSKSAVVLDRLVRAYHPWPGTFTLLPSGEVLKVHQVQVAAATSGCAIAGTIVCADPRQGLLVSTGDGLLELTEVQAPNGRRMAARDYLAGHPIEVGAVLRAS
ncbi:MAG: methionyl-tRNA formyltransferase [Verrucomicrobiaceae bacterium]|nr:methionyl-tRNA formyltransferase [Verrucomicrobiaceae bacterium]